MKKLMYACSILLILLSSCSQKENDLNKEIVPVKEKVLVKEVKLSDTKIDLLKGKTKQLSVTIIPEDADNKNVSYLSSDENIASVSAEGLVTAINAGKANIEVKSEEGNHKATCSVNVTIKQVAVKDVDLNKKELHLKKGETGEIKVIIIPSDATDKTVRWITNNPSIATVENGIVTATGKGETLVGVFTTDGNFQKACKVFVTLDYTEAVSGIELNKTELTLSKGDTYLLEASVLPENAKNRNITWNTSDENIVSVKDGLVTAINSGEIDITATTEEGAFIATCKIKVLAVADPNSFLDERDNYRYKTVKIGNQVWMAENLRYLPNVIPSDQGLISEPYCYVYDYDGYRVEDAKATENYKIYGALYNYKAAVDANVCPKGWHLPTAEEFSELTHFLGLTEEESVATGFKGKISSKMKSTNYWAYDMNGTNESGFTGLPAGAANWKVASRGMGMLGYFWSASSESDTAAWTWTLDIFEDGVSKWNSDKAFGFSIRCVKDKE